MTFVNISPAVYNLGETVCSLNFASRCRSTELGQAKKQSSSTSSSVSATPSNSVPSTPGGRDRGDGEGGESIAKQLLREKKMAMSTLKR